MSSVEIYGSIWGKKEGGKAQGDVTVQHGCLLRKKHTRNLSCALMILVMIRLLMLCGTRKHSVLKSNLQAISGHDCLIWLSGV